MKKLTGFAAMSPERRREVAARGGASVPNHKRGFAVRRDLAVECGRKGGEAHWAGHELTSASGGRKKANMLYPKIGPCEACGAEKAERHHRDENPLNNERSNIAALCFACHMALHAGLRRARKAALIGDAP